jgi:cyclic pyranopterin phosphate synthase
MNMTVDAQPAPATAANAECKMHDLVVRLSVTARCQLRCIYCLPEEAGGCACGGGQELPWRDLMRLVAALHDRFHVRRVRFTGGEPLLRRDLPDLIEAIAELGIPDLAMTTNGQLLAPRAAELRRRGLQRVNISLDSLDPGRFGEISRGGNLARTVEGIRAAQAAGLNPVKLNVVVLRGRNDGEVGDLLHFALQTGCHVRFLELMPIGVAASHWATTWVGQDEIRARLKQPDLTWEEMPWFPQETCRDWRVRDHTGRETVCGFIAAVSQPFCASCRRVRITADGGLHGCLSCNVRHDLNPVLAASTAAEAGAKIHLLMLAAFGDKRTGDFADSVESMCQVGG